MTLSSLAVGSLTLTPVFTPNRTVYYTTWTQGQDENMCTVSFQAEDPEATTEAQYVYLGTDHYAPIYVWGEPPYQFDGMDTPAMISVIVEKDGRRRVYTVYVNRVL